MKAIYRISDNGYKKSKLPRATKKNCLLNFLTHWPLDEVTVLADHCIDSTRQWLQDYSDLTGLVVKDIDGGSSAQGFRLAYEAALELPDDEVVYLVEDDYAHIDHSRRIMLEGISTGADYVSGYDAPDKYRSKHCPYVNPLVDDRGGEFTVVLLTDSCHWKMTNSTTCTFMSTVKILREDYSEWKKWCFKDENQKHPNDFECFLALRGTGRSLITPIPGISSHLEPEWLSPLIDWNVMI